jgi:hypothetical protein
MLVGDGHIQVPGLDQFHPFHQFLHGRGEEPGEQEGAPDPDDHDEA